VSSNSPVPSSTPASLSVSREPSDSETQSKPSEQAAIPLGLVIIATPIGNAADISLRALNLLAAAHVVACEDTRVTAKLFAVHGLKTSMLPYHEHNAATQRPRLIKRLKDGETVALVSDAGMPLISDPGYRLVADCVDADIPITCIPGASAVTTALALSGLPTDRFFFQGFLPNKKAQRCRVLTELATIPGSLVVMESAKRLAAMLVDAANCLGSRDAAVTRELTKRFEEVRRGPLDQLAEHYAEAGAPKGEVTVVIGPAGATEKMTVEEIDALLRQALSTQSVRDAAQIVTAASGWPKRDVYQRALEMAKEISTPGESVKEPE
jgi:16S rRNA (cytidine1402-2'-O)-methyltransferase